MERGRECGWREAESVDGERQRVWIYKVRVGGWREAEASLLYLGINQFNDRILCIMSPSEQTVHNTAKHSTGELSLSLMEEPTAMIASDHTLKAVRSAFPNLLSREADLDATIKGYLALTGVLFLPHLRTQLYHTYGQISRREILTCTHCT